MRRFRQIHLRRSIGPNLATGVVVIIAAGGAKAVVLQRAPFRFGAHIPLERIPHIVIHLDAAFRCRRPVRQRALPQPGVGVHQVGGTLGIGQQLQAGIVVSVSGPHRRRGTEGQQQPGQAQRHRPPGVSLPPHQVGDAHRRRQQRQRRQPGGYGAGVAPRRQPADPYRRRRPRRRQRRQRHRPFGQPRPVNARQQMPQQRGRRQRQRQGNVHQQPRHLFGGDGVNRQGGQRPQGQHHAEGLPPAQQPDHRRHSKRQRQQFVHRQPHGVVIPGLVAPGHILLRQPVAQALPGAGEYARPVGVKSGVQESPHGVEAGGARQPDAAAPEHAYRAAGRQRRQQRRRRQQIVDGHAPGLNIGRRRARNNAAGEPEARREGRQPQRRQQRGTARRQGSLPPGRFLHPQRGQGDAQQQRRRHRVAPQSQTAAGFRGTAGQSCQQTGAGKGAHYDYRGGGSRGRYAHGHGQQPGAAHPPAPPGQRQAAAHQQPRAHGVKPRRSRP